MAACAPAPFEDASCCLCNGLCDLVVLDAGLFLMRLTDDRVRRYRGLFGEAEPYARVALPYTHTTPVNPRRSRYLTQPPGQRFRVVATQRIA